MMPSRRFLPPLRHEVEDLSRLGSGERNVRSTGPRGPSERERASHWAGVRIPRTVRALNPWTPQSPRSLLPLRHAVGERWCLGFTGKSLSFIIFIISLVSLTAQAHIGSPDVFYDGMAGPYPVRVTIRMPNVVPGRAEVSAHVQTSEPVSVSFLPVYSYTPVTNTPPPDVGRLVPGETNLYTGELWLMSFGAYSVEVRVKGAQGEGTSEIPVTSVALRQLPLPSVLGKILLFLCAVLVVGGIGIAIAAGREAALPPGATAGKSERWKGFFAAATATIIFAAALIGGKFWWRAEEGAFRHHLREGPWPDLSADVRVAGSERILRLEVGKKFFERNSKAPLIPDHGKLMHLFLVRQGTRDAFAHLHPIRREGYTFEVALPPLPEGRYSIFCDLTFEGGTSSTATNSILLSPVPVADGQGGPAVERDPDDSWASTTANAVTGEGMNTSVYHSPDGAQVTCQVHTPLRINQDASLNFSVTDTNGEPAALEPYMGMLCHAAVLRSDDAVFAHLHPTGNFSMAAQMFFADKSARESEAGMADMPGMDHSMMHHMHSGSMGSSVYLPYEFPAPGNYRIWVQFKTGGRILTAVFDAEVSS